jgi:acyl-CoA synthetase (AMP-forming)/AMP-acid ligase II
MKHLEILFEKLARHRRADALVWRHEQFTFQHLDAMRLSWLDRLASNEIKPGQVVGLRADYSPGSISLLLALLANRNVVALLSPNTSKEDTLLADSRSEFLFRFDHGGAWECKKIGSASDHPLLAALRRANSAGLIIFSSGSTGRPKAILHDCDQFLAKFTEVRKAFRTLTFLLFDHIAGLDTLFYGLSSGALQVLPEKRDVKHICQLIEQHRVEVLPTSPTFLNMLCVTGEYAYHDLSSLKIITYGSERMSPALLTKLNSVLPGRQFIQKYGMSELGAPTSRSRGNESLWINIKNSACEVKIVQNILWVRSPSAMMGYLNAPSPFDQEGWLCTGDEVLVDGEWIQVLGRKSDIIVVGGEKVYPGEVEEVLGAMDGVCDVIVRGESHPLTGQIVCALVQVVEMDGASEDIARTIRKACRGKLEPYKIPMKIEVTDRPIVSGRGKRQRTAEYGWV